MGPDANDGDGGMVKLDVEVSKHLLPEIDELGEKLAYSSRSEFGRFCAMPRSRF